MADDHREDLPAPDFRRLFEGAPDRYMVLSPSLHAIAFSDAYCRATMIERDKVLGRHLFDIFPDNPDDPNATGVANLRASLMRVLQFRKPDTMAIQKYDVRRKESDGGGFEMRYWAPLNTPIFNQAGDIICILHRADDVTETVRLEEKQTEREEIARRQLHLIEELQSTKRFLDVVVDNVPGMLFVKSYPDCRFVLFNKGAENLLGYPAESFIGRTDHDFFPKAEADHFIANDRAVLEAGTTLLISDEIISTRHQGLRTLRTKKVPVHDAAGRPQYLLGFSEDITDAKVMEQQLRQAVKMEAVGQLTGGLSHDFNNLLGVVIGNIDMALERVAGDPLVKELLTEALNGALKGAELTRRLLAFSRNQPLQPSLTDLNRGLLQMAAMLKRTLGEAIEVELHTAEGLWPALVDAAQVDEAILNLAINARDAMPKGGKLTIETANARLDEDYAAHNAEVRAGEFVLLSISDTGTGMTPEVIERCFEPFFTTKEVEKGTGLGLSMVYGFVKQSGGHIKVYSELGHGTSVKLYLPRATRPGEIVHATPGPEVPESGGEMILVVEDNTDLRAITVRQLADLGYRTLEAENARAALTLLAAHDDIDLLFSDIIMPGGMTGTELAQQTRQLYPNVAILLASGYTARGMASGGDGVDGFELLMKPFRKADLGRKLRDILTRASDAAH